MPGTARKPIDFRDSPRPEGGDGPHPGPDEDWRESGGDVEEPPPPGTSGTEEKFPRKGEI
jgi:hypothetical protein